MTKQEAIEKAWGDRWKSVAKSLDRDGFLEIYSYNPFSETLYLDIRKEWNNYPEEGFYSSSRNAGNTILIRPRSLRELESNNGWTKIESINDFPKESGCYTVIDKGCQFEYVDFDADKQLWYRFEFEYNPTHWRKIVEIPNPLY